ncbi:PspC domain-containing protein [Nocardioides sp. SYSU D00065]|uniref:PspC domain-containing protein n=1 Tax=Nocardioides sp. SYSU D00065 TaxID=2817378 RepID=UPI001B337327|nr:PspC domain-containing protein [Nocardioides sp. SYSU D00065]
MDETTPTTEQPPPSGLPPASGPRVTRDEMKDLGRLRRSVTDRHIAGVAGGIARHLDIDAVIVRVALVVAVFFGGAGLLLYIGAWVLVPEEGTQDEPLALDQRSRTLALGGVGVLALLCAVGDWAGAFWFPWPLAIAAAVVVWFLNRNPRSTPTSGYGYDPAQPSVGGPTPAAAAGDPYAYSPTAPPTAPYTDTYEDTYTDTYAAPGAWAPPTSYAPAPRPPRVPRNPRKRGPRLFFFTLALIALAEGVLGVVDLAGVDVTDSAYPVLALGIVATMLLIGSFWGRAGGLIALGVVAALATTAATIGDDIDHERRLLAPTSATGVESAYEFGGGTFTLDLSRVSDVDALDGRDVAIDGFGGEIEVIVPDGMDVDVRAQVVGGDVEVFDQRQDGIGVNLDGFLDGGDGVPDMTITIDLFAGEILVREA